MTSVNLAAAWRATADRFEEAQACIAALTPQLEPLDVVEGHRLFLRYLSIGLDSFVEYADPRFPAFYSKSRDGVRKFAGDSPSQLYDTAPLSSEYDYEVAGTLDDVALVEFGVYSGDLSGLNPTPRRLVSHLIESEIDLDQNGGFRLLLSSTATGPNTLRLEQDASVLSVRRYLRDPLHDQPAPLRIKRLGVDLSPVDLTPDQLAASVRAAGSFAVANLEMWARWTARTRADKFNVLTPMADAGDIFTPAGHSYLDGYWQLPDADSALVIEFPAPPAGSYWSLVPMNFWMESFEWRFGHPVHATSFDTPPGPDCVVRLALAERDPGLANTTWLRTMGHRQGLLALRLARFDGPPPIAVCRVITLE